MVGMSSQELLDPDAIIAQLKEFLEERRSLGKPLDPRGRILASAATIPVYCRVAKHFLNMMWPKFNSVPLPEDAAREYLSILRKRRKPRTVLVAYAALKNLYACMGWPFSIELRQMLPEGLPQFSDAPYLARDEIEQVIRHAEEKASQSGDPLAIRNVLIAYLLRYGLRPEDIRRLKGENITFRAEADEAGEKYEACIIKYTPCKRGRETVKVLNRRASAWAARWIAILEQILGEEQLQFAPVFPSLRGVNRYGLRHAAISFKKHPQLFKPMSYRTIHHVIRQLLLEALGPKMRERRSPYAIRRGVVSYLLEAKLATAEDLTKYFGWRSLTMPLIYDKRRAEELAKKFTNI